MIFLKSRRNNRFGFWIPPTPNHWEGISQLQTVLHSLWLVGMTAICHFPAVLVWAEGLFHCSNKLSFLCFYSSSHHPNPAKAEWSWHVRESPADLMTSIWGGGGNVANPYGNFYVHTSECEVLHSFPFSSHILFWLKTGRLDKRTFFSHLKPNLQPKPRREKAGRSVLTPRPEEKTHLESREGTLCWQTVLTWLVLSEICFSISCTICLNVGLFRGSASQQVIIMSYLQNKGRVPLLLNGLHLSSDVCHTIISKIIPGVGNWTYWVASALNTLKCCWN